MEKKLEFGFSCLIVLILGYFVVQRPALGTGQLESQTTFAQIIRQVQENTAVSEDATVKAPPDQPTPASVQLAGVDVSHYQGTVDWKALSEADIKFAFAKASEGNTYADPMWSTNKTAAPSDGVLIGGYHFFQPADDPITQARNFIATLGDVSGGLPPVVDLESAPSAADAPQYVENVLTFLSAVSDATGCTPMVYANPSFYGTYLGEDLAQYALWLAEYRSTPPPENGPDWVFWQHSQNGFVDGISGAVDLDWFAGDEQALMDLTC